MITLNIPFNFNIQIEPPQGFRDGTSLNRVSLSCRDGTTLEASGDVAPHPHTKSFGTWGPMTSCQRGHFITSFALQVERPQVKHRLWHFTVYCKSIKSRLVEQESRQFYLVINISLLVRDEYTSLTLIKKKTFVSVI